MPLVLETATSSSGSGKIVSSVKVPPDNIQPEAAAMPITQIAANPTVSCVK
jgi:hypothetical protein